MTQPAKYITIAQYHSPDEFRVVARRLRAFGLKTIPLHIQGNAISPTSWDHVAVSRQSAGDVGRFNWNSAGGIGVVTGPNGIVSVSAISGKDTVQRILQRLSLPSDYSWVISNGSTSDCSIIIRTDVTRINLHTSGTVRLSDGVLLRLKDSFVPAPPSLLPDDLSSRWLHAEPSAAPVEVDFDTLLAVAEVPGEQASHDSTPKIKPPNPKIVYLSGSDLATLDTPPESDMLGGLIRSSSVTFVAGEAGSGKSLLAMNLGLSVAVGREEFLGYHVMKHGKTLYLNYEGGNVDFVRRLQKMISPLTPEERPHLGNFVSVTGPPLLEDFVPKLRDKIKELRPVLLIIDPLYWAHNRSESSNPDMRDLMRLITNLRDEFGLAILIPHHTTKGSSSESARMDHMRGAGALAGAADAMFELGRTGTNKARRVLTPTKLRNAADCELKARILSLDPETLWFSKSDDQDEPDDGETGSDSHVNWPDVFADDSELRTSQIKDRLPGIPERTCSRYLEQAVKRGILKKAARGMYKIVRPASQDSKGLAGGSSQYSLTLKDKNKELLP